jgi:hypothetical protein
LLLEAGDDQNRLEIYIPAAAVKNYLKKASINKYRSRLGIFI